MLINTALARLGTRLDPECFYSPCAVRAIITYFTDEDILSYLHTMQLRIG